MSPAKQYTTEIPALKRLRQEDASLGYIVRFCFKNKTKAKEQKNKTKQQQQQQQQQKTTTQTQYPMKTSNNDK
jgi:hypothetical protein